MKANAGSQSGSVNDERQRMSWLALTAVYCWLETVAAPGPNMTCTTRPDTGVEACAVIDCRLPTILEAAEFLVWAERVRLDLADPNRVTP